MRFGANLRGQAAMAVDFSAHGGDAGLAVARGRQFIERARGGLMRGFGLGAIGRKPRLRFGQGRTARSVAVDLTLGIGVALARGIDLAAGGA